MTIVNKIIESIADDAPVRDVRICTHATIVESVRVGLCGHTRADLAYEVIKRQDVVANHGKLREFSAKNLARYALSKLAIEASVGVAAINSILEVDWTKVRSQSGSDVIIEQSKDKRVAIIGHFPFVDRVRKVAKHLDELSIEEGTGDLSVAEAHTVLPEADVAVITANAIVNHTIDHLLGLAQNTPFVAITGAATIFSPVFFRHGVDVLLGNFIDDVETVIRHLSEGASLHHLPGMTTMAMYSKDFLGV